MQLPDAIRTCFTAEAPRDAEAFTAAFAQTAVVHDEGGIHRGPAEIRAWWQAAKEKYRHRAEPLDLTRTADRLVVRARVSGDFPGSPAILSFGFRLAGDLISDLEIG